MNAIPVFFIIGFLVWLHEAGKDARKRTIEQRRICDLLYDNYQLIHKCILSATSLEQLETCVDMINDRIKPTSPCMANMLSEMLQRRERVLDGTDILENLFRYPETEEA